MDQKPRKDGHDDFGHFKSETLKFVRERLAVPS